MTQYETVIGLEVHCQLKTQTKLFCSCTTKFGSLPNSNACPVCLGHPGVLPVLNHEAVNLAIRFALAVDADVNEKSVFSRKQYFYPDLPKGYQITQYDLPYATDGKIVLQSGKTIRILRAHMEEDAGKNVHAENSSYVDLNRAGMPLIEIVTHPDLSSPEEASEYLKILRSLVRHLDVNEGNLEEGSFRCDANISLRKKGEKLGTRCEIKNLNSFKNIERALRYEILRQHDALEAGEIIRQQTLLFDAASGKTSPMRIKEDSQDYRYFPEPDLTPLILTKERVDAVRKQMPELPKAMSERFEKIFELSSYDCLILTADKDLAHYFEQTIKYSKGFVTAKIAANWLISELIREVNDREWTWEKIPFSAERFAGLLTLIGKEVISGKIAKTVFEEMLTSLKSADEIVKEKGLVQISDISEIEKVVQEIVDSNPEQVQEYLSGRDRVFGFFVGQIMKKSQGKFNPGIVNDILKKKIAEKK